MTDQTPAILFVCLGNICRSPLAEAALRHEAQQAGITLHIDSAGTANWHSGKAPDPRSCAEARRHGIDISGYQARQVSAQDFTRFDHIIAMDGQNLSDLRTLAASQYPKTMRARLSLLLDHVDGMAGQDVMDPYYGGEEGFTLTWQQVSAAARTLIGQLAVS